jgi:transcription elongation GreA/GreB family factor
MTNLKQQLHQSCSHVLASRILAVEQAMHAVQNDAASETKSSAGDKYETGRAMLHLEMEKLSAQHDEFMKSKNALDKIDIQKSSDVVQHGSVILTDNHHYFLAISLGQLEVAGKTFFCISQASPLGQVLLGKKKGDAVTFRDQHFRIINVI